MSVVCELFPCAGVTLPYAVCERGPVWVGLYVRPIVEARCVRRGRLTPPAQRQAGVLTRRQNVPSQRPTDSCVRPAKHARIRVMREIKAGEVIAVFDSDCGRWVAACVLLVHGEVLYFTTHAWWGVTSRRDPLIRSIHVVGARPPRAVWERLEQRANDQR